MTIESDSVRANFVSPDYFASLGVVPAWGRLLDARDSEPGAAAAAMLGYDYWQTHWGADSHVVGRFVRVNNQTVEIAGVLPFNFDGLAPRRTAVWVPIAVRPLLIAGSPPLKDDFARANQALYGKLKPGVSLPAGAAELTVLTRELGHRQPRFFNADDRVEGQRVADTLVRSLAPAIGIFFVMVLLVLVSACANLGNMLVARGLARQREIAIRMSIGAGRARVVRQLMTENLLLAFLGAAAGLAFGSFAVRLLMYALNVSANIHISLRWPVLVAGFFLIFLSTIAFGLPSALQIVNPNRPKNRFRQSLIGVQVAVSCLLLIASGVLAHNGIVMASIEIAFDYQNMIEVDPQLNAGNLPPAVARQKLEALSERLAGLPGVDRVTAAAASPLGGGLGVDSLPGLPRIFRNAVAPSYFAAMNLALIRGQTFLPGEQNAVIVSESAARAIWPNQDPVGKIWTFAGAERTVAGVVKDSGANLLADAESIEAYIPLDGPQIHSAELILHSLADPAPLLRMIPSAVDGVNQNAEVSLMRATRENSIQGMRRLTTLIGSIGAVASALAAAGMFALVAFTVAQRRREFGIRIAIGARPRHILTLLVAQNSRPVLVGSIAGAVLAVALSRVVRSQMPLQNLNAVDPAGFALGIGCFLVIATLAALSPALRALKIDPAATLRDE